MTCSLAAWRRSSQAAAIRGEASPCSGVWLEPALYPTTIKVGEAYKSGRMAPPDHERNFEFGLQRVLDGVEAFIARR